MSDITQFLEDFSKNGIGSSFSDPTLVDGTTLEEHRIEAFEQGYKAGWDDASKAQSDELEHISVEFARNMQAMAFTHAEAQSKVVAAMEPLLKSMVEAVLPKLAADNIGPLLLQEVQQITRDTTEAEVQIVVSPGARSKLDALAEDFEGLSYRIVEEDTLAEGQIFARLGFVERQIDVNAALTKATALVDDFFEETKREANHG